ncbi:uncharacterized protein LOC122529803 [Frieseomelitta varia]|uniref:uncharacterized protein LOC122529803 n=1 Tax=Frieseomelitta varia TaxID=561572 RepID=UPI001CB695DE|nr:uncharacterized protein LOC122529803 [Frieseomelitta varia]
MDLYVRPPESLSTSGDMIQNWQKWKKDFMIFMEASNCINKPKNHQAYLLRTYIGKMGQDIIEKLVSNNLKERDDMNILLAKLDKHFCHHKNEVIERYNFFNSNKKPDESIEDYIVNLKNKAKDCNFGKMTDSLIRDKIILEFKNKQLRQKLFNVENLNLSRLVSIFNEHASTMRKDQQNVPKKTNNIDNVSDDDIKNRNGEASSSNRNEKSVNIQNRKNCSKCNQRHPMRACPAWGLKCEKCGKYNHYTNCCPYKFIEKKEINEKTNSLNVNPQRDNQQCPTAPPISDIDHVYPNLNYVRSQEAMNTINWSYMENRSNENFQRSAAPQHPNMDQRTSNMENKPHKTSNSDCRLS